MGFNEGYSTLSLFLCPNFKIRGLPFFDARLHVFNNAYLASNIGVGARVSNTSGSCVFGLNAYYDYRNYKSLTSHQGAGGLEILSKWVDFRLNGYYPFSGKYDASSLSFSGFRGHSLIIQEHVRYALPCADGELGVTLPGPFKELDFYLSMGGYYLFKQTAIRQSEGNVLGGRARLTMTPADYVSIGAEYTYDKLFGSRLDGFIAFHFPLGSRRLQHSTVHHYPYQKSKCDLFVERMKLKTQDVIRNEIIPIKSENYKFPLKTNGVNGVGEDLHFIFVNNQNLSKNGVGSGDGSFENPFTTLSLAQANSAPNNIIYVFFGNGTTNGYNTGFTLKSNQVLTSSALALSVSGIVIPPFTPGQFPSLTNTNGPVITASSIGQATVRGFTLKGINDYTVSASSTAITLTQNTVIGGAGYGSFKHTNPLGQTVISSNTFAGAEGSSTEPVLNISNAAKTTFSSYNIESNVIFPKRTQTGISLTNLGNSPSVKNNTITYRDASSTTTSVYGIFSNTDSITLATTSLNVSNNNISMNSPDYGIYFTNNTNAILHATLSGNSVSTSSSSFGIYVINQSAEPLCLNATNNVHVPAFAFIKTGDGVFQMPSSDASQNGIKQSNNPNASYTFTNINFVPLGSPCPPFQAVFVNNTANASTANGSFAFPWPTLSQAQANSVAGDLIYVFEGDGTNTGYNQGFVLKNDQTLAGSGTTFIYKGTTIPASTSGNPVISTSSANSPIIQFTSGSSTARVVGLSLLGSTEHSSISSTSDVSNLSIENNTIIMTFKTGSSQNAINISDTSNTHNVSILNNTITVSNSPNSIPINLVGTSATTIQGNVIKGNDSLINFNNGSSGSTSLTIAGNTLQGLSENCIKLETSITTTPLEVFLYDNLITSSTPLYGTPTVFVQSASLATCDIHDNQIFSLNSMTFITVNHGVYKLNNNYTNGGSITFYYDNATSSACIQEFRNNFAAIYSFTNGGNTGSAQINTTSLDNLKALNNPLGTYHITGGTFAPPGTPCP